MEDRWRHKHQDTLDELQQAQLHLSEARQRIDSLRSQDTAMQLQVGGFYDDAGNSGIAVQLFLQRAKQQIEDLQQDAEGLKTQLTDALAAEQKARQALKAIVGKNDTERDELQRQLAEAVQKADENQTMWTEKLMEMQKVHPQLGSVV